MSRLMIIGCGGVASVAIHKCCQNSEIFEEIMIASRTVSKCDALKEKLQPTTRTKITTSQVDADHVEELTALIRSYQPDAVLNVALPYQDLTIMDACLAAGVHYIDTANYEAENTDDPKWRAVYEERCRRLGFSAYFDYSWQWAYQERYEKAGLTALLGTGFDPGVTSVFTAYAQKHYFDEIHTIDILDCNGGDHGYPFATNFNPEINLREVSAPGSYWEDGKWVEIPPMSIKREYNFAGVGKRICICFIMRRLKHWQKNIPGVKRIRFFHDLWTKLSDTYEMSGKCRAAFHNSCCISGTVHCADTVFKGVASRSGISGTENSGENKYRLYLHRNQGRKGKEYLYL